MATITVNSVGNGVGVGGININHLVTLSATTTAPTVLDFNLISGSATIGVDTATPITFSNGVTRSPITGQLIVPAGVTTFFVTIPTIDDNDFINESYTLTVGDKNGTGIIITNDPLPNLTVFSVGNGQAIEGNNIAHLVTLDRVTTEPTLFDLSLSNGTATVGLDTGANITFSNGVTRSPITGQLIVPAGVTTFTVNVPATSDNLVEGAETYNLNIGGKTAVGTIQDGLAPLQVLSVSNGQATEGTEISHLVTLSRATTEPTLFELNLNNGSASFAIDAGFPVSFSNGVTRSFITGQLIVPAGVTSFNIIVPTLTDTLTEATETYSIGVNDRTATGTITDFVPSNVTVVSVSTAQATEGNTINHNVVLSAQTTSAINLPFSLSNVSSTNGNATLGTDTVNPVTFTNGVTYNANTGQILVPAGVTNFSVQVATATDTLTEGSETYAINVGGQSGFGTIIDPVVLPVVNLTLNPATATEGNNLTHNVVLTNPTTQATSVAFSLTNGSATLGQDTRAPITFSNGVTYNAESGLLNIPSGVSNFDIVIPTIIDTLTEGAETYTIQVGSQTTTGTIRDVIEVMPPPTVSTVSNGTAVEGVSIRHLVTLSSATTESTQYLLTLTNGTAVLGTDTVALPTFTNGVTYSASTNLMTVPAGVTSFEIIISTIDDTLVEASESYSLTVVSSNATGTITDNDTANTVFNAVDDSITQTYAAGIVKISPASLLSNDTAPSNTTLTIVNLKNALNGVVSYDGTDIVFTPNPAYKGPASFEYEVSDAQGNLDTAVVSFNVTASFGTANANQWNGTDLNDKLFGLAGIDTLNGGLGNDEIDGGVDNDILNGEAGNDIVFGNDGDDNIRGGTGNDDLYGGSGNDTFVWKATDTADQGIEVDVVKDFVVGDKLDLRDLLQNESYTLESLDNYLHFDVSSSEGLKIQISVNGSFGDNQAVGISPTTGTVDQTITLSNINLNGAVNNADVIALMLANNILVTE